MNFTETEIMAVGMIGFDMIDGPYLKFYRQFQDASLKIDMENFLMNFYLSFRGGDESLQPLAILYDSFYVVAFPRGLELCCLFMHPGNLGSKLSHLGDIASELILQMDEEEQQVETAPAEVNLVDETKRIVINLLHGQEKSTPELRRYFKLSNSEIWRVMSQLEETNAVVRTHKVGRTQFWTAV
jgi:hypothetical protein